MYLNRRVLLFVALFCGISSAVFLKDASETMLGTNGADIALLPRIKRQLGAMALDGEEMLQADRGHETLWHSYQISYSNLPRDELMVKEVRQVISWLRAARRWMSLPGHHGGIVLGIESSALVLCRLGSHESCAVTELSGGNITTASMSHVYVGDSEARLYVAAVIRNVSSTHHLAWFSTPLHGQLQSLTLTNSTPWPLLDAPLELHEFHVHHQHVLLMLHRNSVELFHVIPEEGLGTTTVTLRLAHRLSLQEATSAAVSHAGGKVFVSVARGGMEVVVFEMWQGGLRQTMVVPSRGVTQICSFQTGSFSFLAIAGDNPQVFPMPPGLFNKNKVERAAVLNATVTRWIPVPVDTYRDEVVLLAEVNQGQQLEVLTWNPPDQFRVQKVEIQQLNCVLSDGTITLGLECIKGVGGILEGATAVLTRARHDSMLVLPSSKENSLVFHVLAAIEHVLSPSQIQRTKIEERINRIKALQLEQEVIVKEAERRLQFSLKPNGPNVITAPWTVDHVTVPSLEVTGHLETERTVVGGQEWSSKDWTNLASALELARVEIKEVTKKMENLRHQVGGLVTLDQDGNVEIRGHREFGDNKLIVKGKMIVPALDVGHINGHAVQNLLQDTVRISSSKPIVGHKTVPSLNADELLVTETINGHRVEPFASRAEVIDIHGNLEFQQVLDVDGDLKLTPTNSSDQARAASDDVVHSFDHLKAKSVEVTDYINTSPASSGTGQYVELEPLQSLEVKGDVEVITINGVNLENLKAGLVPLESSNPVHIPGDVVIKSCYMGEEVRVKYLNALSFPDDYVLKDSPAEISGRKTFEGPLLVDHLEVTGELDSVPVSDLVTLNTDQVLYGEWTFDDLEVKGNLQVDDVEALERAKLTIEDSKTDILHSPSVEFEHLVIDGCLIAPTLNMFSDFVYTDSHEELQTITAQKDFLSTVEVENLELHGTINKIKPEYFITVDSKQTIPGNKTFKGALNFGHLDVAGTILHVDLRSLTRDALRLSGVQTSLSNMIFLTPLVVPGYRGLHVESLNGLVEKDLITLHTDQTLPMNVLTLNDLHTKGMEVHGDLNTTSRVNGINLVQLDKDRVSASKDQVITGSWSTSKATITGVFNVPKVNGHDLRNLRSAPIVERLRELDQVHIQNLLVDGEIDAKLINGFNFTGIANEAVWINGENVISGNLIVLGSVEASNMTVNEKFNKEIFKNFANDFVMHNEHEVTFNGHTTLSNGAHIGKIKTSYVNGRSMRDFLTTTSDQTISGPFIVDKIDISDYGRVEKLNDINTEELRRRYEFKDKKHIIYGDIHFTDPVSIENMQIAGPVMGQDIESVLNDIVWINDDIIMNGNVTIDGKVLARKNLRISGTLNGLNLHDFLTDVVLLDQPATIKTHVTFIRDVYADEGLEVRGDLMVGLLDGCSTEEWTTHAVYLDQQTAILGAKIFNNMTIEGPMEVKYLNDLDLSHVVVLQGDQTIPKVVTFSKVISPNHVSVGGKVNDHRLDREFENTLLVEGKQDIESKTFLGKVHVRRDLTVPETINGYKMEHFAKLDSDQEIHEGKQFEDMEILHDLQVQGTVEGTDLSSWQQQVVLKDKPGAPISAHWDVLGNVIFAGDVGGEGETFINGVNINNLSAAQSARRWQAERDIAMALKDRDHFCQNIKNLLFMASKQAYVFQYVENLLQLPMNHSISSFVHVKLGQWDVMIVSLAEACEGHLLLWDPRKEQLKKIANLAIGGVANWMTLPPFASGDVLLVTAGGLQGCPHGQGSLWLLRKSQPIQLQHVQTMGDWVAVEVSQVDPHVIYTVSANGSVDEWRHQPGSMTLVRTKNFGVLAAAQPPNAVKTRSVSPNSIPETTGNNTFPGMVLCKGPSGSLLPSNLTLGLHAFSMRRQANEETRFTIATDLTRARVQGRHDDIKIYEGSPHKDRLVHRLPATNPGLVQTVQFGPQRETFLVYMEDYHYLQIYRYQGIAGFILTGSVKLPGARLLGVAHLPRLTRFNPIAVLVMAAPPPEPALFLMEMRMLGDPVSQDSTFLDGTCPAH